MNSDVVFAMDASGSIGSDNFELQTEFVRVRKITYIYCVYFRTLLRPIYPQELRAYYVNGLFDRAQWTGVHYVSLQMESYYIYIDT